MRNLMLFAFALLLSVTVWAQANPCEAEGTASAPECAQQALKDAEAWVGRVFQRALASPHFPDKAALRRSQQAWGEYADSECRFESSGVKAGSAQDAQYRQCMLALTSTRAKQLEGVLNQP